MTIERHITFIIGKGRVTVWKINRLKKLTSFFRSVIIWQNITTAKMSSAEHPLKVMSLGCKENDLCQLWIEGSDAELACMVLTDFIADQFQIVNTSHKCNVKETNSIIENHLTFHLPFSIDYHFETIQVHDGIEKDCLISKISTISCKKLSQQIFEGLRKRESISSTGIGNNIAIPHLVINGVEKPIITVIHLDKAINWNTSIGKVNLIITMLMPEPLSPEVAKTFAQIARAMVDPLNCHFLTRTIDPEAIKAILFHIMAKGIRS